LAFYDEMWCSRTYPGIPRLYVFSRGNRIMNYKNLIIEIKDEIGFLYIVNPEKGNALSDVIVKEFIDLFSKTSSDVGARVVVIRGMGKKFFCSGADVEEYTKKNMSQQREAFLQYALLFETMRQSPMISIAAVNGLALGGGCSLAAMCDIAIASTAARFGLPEINVGLVPTLALIPVMRSIGVKMTFLLATRGHFITAEEAYKMGLVSSVVEEEKLDDEATKIGSDLVGKSEIVLRLTKKAIQEGEQFNYSRSYGPLEEINTSSLLTEDSKEGIVAFIEKRQPIWRHR
jgi:enoyl-CoA hydratase